MPGNSPKSLGNEQAYQVVAYVLYLNGIIEQNYVTDANSIREITMPNANGFIDRSHIQ